MDLTLEYHELLTPDKRFPIKSWWRLPKVVGINE